MAIRPSLQSPKQEKAPPRHPAKVQPEPKPARGRQPRTVNTETLADLRKQIEIQQQALEAQSRMAKEISDLRQQLAQQSAQGTKKDSALLTEVETLRKENATLQEKANRLDQMALLFGSSPTSPATASGAEDAERPSAIAKTPAQRGRRPAAAKVVTGSAILLRDSWWQAIADADVKRTYKSCWPVVLKIEEWNQHNPDKMAKVSQTMLNKSGVNFSRAKGFIDTYDKKIQQYHEQIGLTKANSGRFNEVYEFIRAALGKGRK